MDTPRELEWYLRDHFFKQLCNGKSNLARGTIAGEMVSMYLRYRGYDPQELDRMMSSVIDKLISARVLVQNEDAIAPSSTLFRMQCAACYYINYLVDVEPKACQRCLGTNLHEFPKRK